MTTLTSELKDESSPVYQWFNTKHNKGGDQLIAHHNKVLSHRNVIGLSQYPQGFDYALAGTAFIYAFRIKMGWLSNNNPKTVASYCLDSEFEQVLLNAQTDNEIAVAALLLAIFEQRYRNSRKHAFEDDLLTGIKSKNVFQNEALLKTVADLKLLVETIPNIWNDSSYIVKYQDNTITDNRIFINATFSACDFMNADAQQIINGVLIKCFSTKSKQPFSKYHLWQQIAYALLDRHDEYKISHICWYYSRQRVIFMHPIETLFKCLADAREGFYTTIEADFDAQSFDELPKPYGLPGGFWDDDNYISYRG